MTSVVVPFRESDPKRRLEVGEDVRRRLAHAMLRDVVDAALRVGPVVVVADALPPLPDGVHSVPDPGRGQGAAVLAGLSAAAVAGSAGPFVVVNADVPCVVPRDLLALVGAVPDDGVALVRAADGTTNALAFARAELFEPLYGPGSAERYMALASSRVLDVANLADDVDSLDDLVRVAPRAGRYTRAVLASLRLGAAA